MKNPKFLLIIFVLFAISAQTHSIKNTKEECISDKIQQQVKVGISSRHDSTSEKQERKLLPIDYSPIRIYLDYTNANYTKENTDFVKLVLMPYLIKYFEFLQLKPSTQNITFPKTVQDKKCYHVDVPQAYIDTGVNADLVLFITNENVESTMIRAWAAFCIKDGDTNRPTFGQLNLPERSISREPKDWYKMVMTIVHEILHVVGINKLLFESFIDANGAVLGIDKVKKATTIRDVKTEIVITPKTVKAVRDHFNCDTLEGAELENEGTELYSHLERRVFGNEIMTSSYQKTAVLSNISLAILEDSGWYRVNYSFFENITLGFGKNAGCKFSTDPCLDRKTGKSNNPSYFCDVANQTGCTYDGFSKGICSLYNSTQIVDDPFDYFPNTNYTSNDPYMDNCPVNVMYSNGDCRDPINSLDIGYLPERYSATSRCFVGNLLPIHLKSFADPLEKQKSLCLESMCLINGNGTPSLKIMVQNKTIDCPAAGGQVNLEGYYGSVTCPEVNAFCANAFSKNLCPSQCSKNGNCINGVCQCNTGFLGTDCSLVKCTDNSTCSSPNGQCNTSTGTCSCKLGWTGAKCETKQSVYWCPACNDGQTDCYGDECVCFTLFNRNCTINAYNITKNETSKNTNIARTIVNIFSLSAFFVLLLF